jgi:hypothetical protein
VPWPHQLLFFRADGTFDSATMLEHHDWAALGLAGPGRDGITHLAADGDRLAVRLRAERTGEPSCCPSATVDLHVVVGADGPTITDAVLAADG